MSQSDPARFLQRARHVSTNASLPPSVSGACGGCIPRTSPGPRWSVSACGLRPPKFEHRDGPDSVSLALVLGKTWVAPGLLSVDAVAFIADHIAYGHLVRLGSAFDTAFTGDGQVVVPVRVDRCSTSGCEYVDDVRIGVVREVHHRVDVLPPALPAALMHQDQRSAFESPANLAPVRSELRDGLRVPVAHVELLSFTIPG